MTNPTELLGSLIAGAAPVVAAVLVVLWLLAAWWVYLDMARRSDSELAQLGGVGWILVSTPLLLVLSLPIYLLARPRSTAAQERSAQLARAMAADAIERLTDGACPGCGEVREEGWRRCPSCATWLEAACGSCGKWSGIELGICPWCATERAAIDPRSVRLDVPASTADATRVAAPTMEKARRPVGAARLARQ